jgi:hypothetical protein
LTNSPAEDYKGVVTRPAISPTRRQFVAGLATAAAALAAPQAFASNKEDAYILVAMVDRKRILAAANGYLTAEPLTVTSAHSDRSKGGLHDYFSEGDYWWPDPKNPTGPYIRRDGYTNPDNFDKHREVLIRLSLLAPTLAAAWRLTKDKRYSAHFTKHLRAWFVDEATRMNPNLEYAQAISGVSPGRGIGVIDTLQLVEVVRAARLLEAEGGLTPSDADAIRAWFAAYITWMSTSKNGTDEEKEKNNHGTCWVLQMAEFSQFAHRPDLTKLCIELFKTKIVPDQIAKDGSLPLELARTKPYSYSLFDMDVLSGICQSLSTPTDNLWTVTGPNGKGVGDVVAFMFPYIADKSKWPFAKDVEFFDAMPSRRPSLLFAGVALAHSDYLTVWKSLDANPTVPELIRNLPIRQPLLWVDPILQR